MSRFEHCPMKEDGAPAFDFCWSGFKAGAASRDAEVAELKAKLSQIEYCAAEYDIQFDKLTAQVTLLRDALRNLWNERTPDSFDEAGEALAATELGSTRQDKSAIFKSLGLVPWDNKPPACTDTVWIEPGKVAIKEIKE